MAANFGIGSVGISGAGNDVLVTADGQMHTVMASMVDEGNSTNEVLMAGVTFTGEAIDVLDFSVMAIAVYSDVVSAVDGLSIEFSTDGINWDHCDVYTIAADTGKTYGFQPVAKYFRIVYTNGPSSPQSVFRLQVLLHKTYVKPSSHRIADAISGQDDAELAKSVLTGLSPSNSFVNVMVTNQGRLDVSALNEKLSIATEQIPGSSFIEKFGRNADVDTPGNEYIWSGGGLWVRPTQARVHNLSSSSPNDTLLGSGAHQVSIEGLDTDWNPQSEIVDMDGVNNVATSGLYVIIHRMEIISCGASSVNEGIIFATAVTDATITAQIDVGKGKTTMAIYGVKDGAKLYLEQIYASLNASANPANQPSAVLELKVIKFADTSSPCNVLEHVWGVSARGTSNPSHEFKVSKVIEAKSIVYIQTESVTESDSDISAGFDGYLIDDPV